MPGLKNYSLLVAMAALHMSSNAECSVLRIRDEDDDASGSILDITNNFKANAAKSSGPPSPAPPAEKHSDDDGSGSNSEQPKDSQAAAPANKPSALSETQGGANGESQGA